MSTAAALFIACCFIAALLFLACIAWHLTWQRMVKAERSAATYAEEAGRCRAQLDAVRPAVLPEGVVDIRSARRAAK